MRTILIAASAMLAFTSMAEAYAVTGTASYYGGGGRTASGGRVGAMTAAHRSLPFGTQLRVTNLANQQSAVVTVNDRGPFIRGRIVDVSTGAAGVLGMRHSGTAPVRIEVVSAGAEAVPAGSSAASASVWPTASTRPAATPATSLFGAGDHVW